MHAMLPTSSFTPTLPSDCSVDSSTLEAAQTENTHPDWENDIHFFMVVNQEGDIANSMEGVQRTNIGHDSQQSAAQPQAIAHPASTAEAASTFPEQRDARKTLHKKKSSYDLRDDFQSSAPSKPSL